MRWTDGVCQILREGENVTVRPRGRSMSGTIEDGSVVVIAPCVCAELRAGDIVLAQVQGKKYTHIVLHKIHDVQEERFLIGGSKGRIDGWIDAHNIFGRVIQIEANGDQQ